VGGMVGARGGGSSRVNRLGGVMGRGVVVGDIVVGKGAIRRCVVRGLGR
jgi:hypothetical protein